MKERFSCPCPAVYLYALHLLSSTPSSVAPFVFRKNNAIICMPQSSSCGSNNAFQRNASQQPLIFACRAIVCAYLKHSPPPHEYPQLCCHPVIFSYLWVVREGTETGAFVARVAANVWPCLLRSEEAKENQLAQNTDTRCIPQHRTRHDTHSIPLLLLLSVTGAFFVPTHPSNHDCVQGCYQRRRSGKWVPLLPPSKVPQLHFCLFESLVYSLRSYTSLVKGAGVCSVDGTRRG